MGNITLKQYNGSTVLPKDDAILYDFITGQQNGIIYGCDITWSGGNLVHVGAGYGIIRGRLFEVAEHNVYVALPSSDSTYYGYMYLSMDLENIDEPIGIYSSVSLTEWKDTDWTQNESINHVNGVWEMPIASYKATNAGVSSFVSCAPKVEKPYLVLKSFAELTAVTEEGYLLDALLMKKQILTYANKAVAVSSWVSDTTYEDYPYRASVPCSGVDANYVPSVMFDASDCNAGILAPVAVSASNAVYIYANEKPTATITIPTIQCIRKAG